MGENNPVPDEITRIKVYNLYVYNTNNVLYFSATESSEFYYLRKISKVQEICLRFE